MCGDLFLASKPVALLGRAGSSPTPGATNIFQRLPEVGSICIEPGTVRSVSQRFADRKFVLHRNCGGLNLISFSVSNEKYSFRIVNIVCQSF